MEDSCSFVTTKNGLFTHSVHQATLVTDTETLYLGKKASWVDEIGFFEPETGLVTDFNGNSSTAPLDEITGQIIKTKSSL
jgi:hypothetical protein